MEYCLQRDDVEATETAFVVRISWARVLRATFWDRSCMHLIPPVHTLVHSPISRSLLVGLTRTGVRTNQNATVADPNSEMGVALVDWVATTRGCRRLRRTLQRLDDAMQPPCEVLRRCIYWERLQASADDARVLQLFERAVSSYGEHDDSLWLDFAKVCRVPMWKRRMFGSGERDNSAGHLGHALRHIPCRERSAKNRLLASHTHHYSHAQYTLDRGDVAAASSIHWRATKALADPQGFVAAYGQLVSGAHGDSTSA